MKYSWTLLLGGCASGVLDAPWDVQAIDTADHLVDIGTMTDVDTEFGSTPDTDTTSDTASDIDTASDSDTDTASDSGSASDSDTDTASDSDADTASDTTPPPPPRPPIAWYVDDDAPPGGDGLSWGTALTHPQLAVDQAQWGDEVWVAEGTYKPLVRTDCVLCMADGVSVYGGFAGTETSVSERALPTHTTTLDALGQLYPVVVAASDVTLDGMEITGGRGPDECYGSLHNAGGGVRLRDVANVAMRNLDVHDNMSGVGGGIGAIEASFSLTNSFIHHNRCHLGGCGIEAMGWQSPPSRAVVEDTTIAENTFSNLSCGAEGSAIVSWGVSLSFERSVIRTSVRSGTGVALGRYRLRISHSLLEFFGAHMTPAIDAQQNTPQDFLVVEHSTLVLHASTDAGAREFVLVQGNAGTFNSVVFWNEGPSWMSYDTMCFDGDGYWCVPPYPMSARYSLVHIGNGATTDLGGNFYGNPGFRDPANGDFHLTQGSPAIDAGWADAAPQFDLDGLPLYNDVGTPDSGGGLVSYADVGAYEFQGTTTLWLDEPSAAATWTVGEAHTIAWHGGSGTVAIELQRDNNPWEVLATGLSATDSAWTWTVSGAPSERAWVRVRQEGTTDLWDVADLPVVLAAAP